MKRIKLHNIRSWAGVVALLMMTSCNSWLDVKPQDKITEDDLFESMEGFYLAENGLYQTMAEKDVYGCELSCGYIDVLAQMYKIEEQMIGSAHPYLFMHQYAYTDPGSKGFLDRTWSLMYSNIAACNNIIDNMPKKRHVFTSEEHYNTLLGRLLGLRAFLHFDVFRLWGPMYNESTKTQKSIPYYTKRSPLPVAYSTAEEVIELVLSDLYAADSLIVISEKQKSNKMLMSKAAAKALRARVYLYAGNKEKAYEEVQALQNDQNIYKYSWATRTAATAARNPDRLFYHEQIFLLDNSKRSQLYDSYFDHMLEDREILAVTSTYIAELFPNILDYRYNWWKLNPGNGKEASFVKFERIGDDNLPQRTIGQSLFKISELELIAAESAPTEQLRVRSLEILRTGRGYQFGSVTDAEKQNWEATLQKEYLKEFYGEGQYFFYLKRKAIAKIASFNTGGTVDMGPAQYEPPLPDSETQYH
ncbi:MAG: RagB/SusD family nutrient uptake outer membrane protein [Marinifilaceae bacterium]